MLSSPMVTAAYAASLSLLDSLVPPEIVSNRKELRDGFVEYIQTHETTPSIALPCVSGRKRRFGSRTRTRAPILSTYKDLPPYIIVNCILSHAIAMFGRTPSDKPAFVLSTLHMFGKISSWEPTVETKNEFPLYGYFKKDVSRSLWVVFRSMFLHRTFTLSRRSDIHFKPRNVRFFGTEILHPLMLEMKPMPNIQLLCLPARTDSLDFISEVGNWSTVPKLQLLPPFDPAASGDWTPPYTSYLTDTAREWGRTWKGNKLHFRVQLPIAFVPWVSFFSENLTDLRIGRYNVHFVPSNFPNLKRLTVFGLLVDWAEFATTISPQLTHFTMLSIAPRGLVDIGLPTTSDKWNFQNLLFLRVHLVGWSIRFFNLLMAPLPDSTSGFPKLHELMITCRGRVTSRLSVGEWSSLPALKVLNIEAEPIILDALIRRVGPTVTKLTAVAFCDRLPIPERPTTAWEFGATWELERVKWFILSLSVDPTKHGIFRFSPAKFNAIGIRSIKLSGIAHLGGAFMNPKISYPSLQRFTQDNVKYSGTGDFPTIVCKDLKLLHYSTTLLARFLFDYNKLVHLHIEGYISKVPPAIIERLTNEIKYSINHNEMTYLFGPLLSVLKVFGSDSGVDTADPGPGFPKLRWIGLPASIYASRSGPDEIFIPQRMPPFSGRFPAWIVGVLKKHYPALGNVWALLEIAKLSSALVDKEMCVICQKEKKCAYLLPCRHIVLCRECSSEYPLEKCPTCGTGVDTTTTKYPALTFDKPIGTSAFHSTEAILWESAKMEPPLDFLDDDFALLFSGGGDVKKALIVAISEYCGGFGSPKFSLAVTIDDTFHAIKYELLEDLSGGDSFAGRTPIATILEFSPLRSFPTKPTLIARIEKFRSRNIYVCLVCTRMFFNAHNTRNMLFDLNVLAGETLGAKLSGADFYAHYEYGLVIAVNSVDTEVIKRKNIDLLMTMLQQGLTNAIVPSRAAIFAVTTLNGAGAVSSVMAM